MFCEGNNEVSFRSIVRYFRKRKKKKENKEKKNNHVASTYFLVAKADVVFFFFFSFFTLYTADVRHTRAQQQHEDFSIPLRDRDVLSFEEILLLRNILPWEKTSIERALGRYRRQTR